jgi:hypothetical protein
MYPVNPEKSCKSCLMHFSRNQLLASLLLLLLLWVVILMRVF